MKITAPLVTLAAVLLLPLRADAQEVRLHIENGVVTLDAQNVSVRQILAEWARVGGTTIVNGDKVIGAPVTLHLAGTPERQALDTILRGVSGYMLAARQVPGAGSSSFDRILIMPTSSAPRAATPSPASNAPFTARPVPVQPVPEPVDTEIVPDEDYDEPEAVEPEPDEEEAEAQPGNVPFQRPQRFRNPMGPQGQPFSPAGAGPGGPPAFVPQETPDGGQPSTAPLNVPPGASAMPGVISPVPQQPEDEQPVNRPPSPRRPPL